MAGSRRCLELFALAHGASLLLAAGVRAEESAPPYRLTLSGLVQVDGVPYHQASLDELDPASGEPLNLDRISIARAWLSASGRYEITRTSDGCAAIRRASGCRSAATSQPGHA